MVPPVDVSLKIEPLSHCVCYTISQQAEEAIIMLLVNYGNVVAENIIKTRCIRIK